jgi:hypothetical protein
MEQSFVEALTVRIENQQIAVLNAKQLPAERRLRQALLKGVRVSGQFQHFVVVEKLDAVSEELIAVDIDDTSVDLTFELAAAALAKQLFRSSSKAAIVCNFIHQPSGVHARVSGQTGMPSAFDVTLLRVESAQSSLSNLELKHAYLESPIVMVSMADAPAVAVSLLAAHKTVFAQPGKSVVVAMRGDALNGAKKKNQLHELNAAAQQQLMSLIKHIAASLHIAQVAVQVLLIWPSAEADFKAAEWVNEGGTPVLNHDVSAGGLVSLAELASVPGSLVQTIARVLPGVPSRIAHASGIVEMMANNVGVTRSVRVLPVAQGKLFSHSI